MEWQLHVRNDVPDRGSHIKFSEILHVSHKLLDPDITNIILDIVHGSIHCGWNTLVDMGHEG